MTSKKNKARISKADLKKPGKKKPNVLDTERIAYVDYKDVNLLQRFMSDRSKIRGQRIAGTSVQQQREIANAVKNAREMALLPYTKRVASARAPRPGADREDDERYVDKYADKVADGAASDGAATESTDVESAGDDAEGEA
jgi:small subunit ribosomal protein S18